MLEAFTRIGEVANTSDALAVLTNADARATQILCDYLAIFGFFMKAEDRVCSRQILRHLSTLDRRRVCTWGRTA